MNLTQFLLGLHFFEIACMGWLAYLGARWEERARTAWQEELQLVEWLEELGWTVGRAPDGRLFLISREPDAEEARLAKERNR